MPDLLGLTSRTAPSLPSVSTPTSTPALGPRLAYLSGSPRIATIPEAENAGPRTHILSFIEACQHEGFTVERYIQGDLVPRSWVIPGSQARASGGWHRALAVDVMRLHLARRASRSAHRQLGQEVDWVYERFAAFCSLGRPFQHQGLPWILETNAPMFYEAKTERKTMALTWLAHRQEMAAYRDCDVLVCVTDVLKELVVRYAGIPPSKVVVVPNGVDTARFDPARVQARRLHAGFTIVFVGTIIERQGIPLLIRAIHALRSQDIPLHAVLIGTGAGLSEAQSLTHRLGLSSVVTFTGQVAWEEIPPLLAGADLAYSGQLQLPVGGMYHSPLKLYEYLAMGLPVVASAFADAIALLQDASCGYLFTPGDQTDLERVLGAAYRQRERQPAMGQRGRARVMADHSWTSRLHALLDACRGILPSHLQLGVA